MGRPLTLKTTVVVSARVSAVDLANTALLLQSRGFAPRTRSDIIGSALKMLSSLSTADKLEDLYSAHRLLDDQWPVATRKFGRQVGLTKELVKLKDELSSRFEDTEGFSDDDSEIIRLAREQVMRMRLGKEE